MYFQSQKFSKSNKWRRYYRSIIPVIFKTSFRKPRELLKNLFRFPKTLSKIFRKKDILRKLQIT